RGTRVSPLAPAGVGAPGNTGVAIQFLFWCPSMRVHALRGSDDKFVCLLAAQQRQRVTFKLRTWFATAPCVGGMRIRVDAVDHNLLTVTKYFDFVCAAVR